MLQKAGLRALSAALLVTSSVVGMVAGAPPAGAVVRDVSRFACAPGLTTPFTDIAGTTHEAAIACAVHYELTGGTSATTFGPDGIVGRGQMATFLANLLGLDDVQPGEFEATGFQDIAGSPHEGSIEAMVELGIAQGTSATTFSPGDPVSRGQMATFLHRMLDLLGVTLPAPGPDAFDDDDGLSHEPAIQALADAGLAGGTGAGTFTPGGTVTRGAMTSFLVRVIDLGIEQGLYAPFVTSESFAALAGATEVPGPGDGDGSGTLVAITTDVPGVLCFGLDVDGIAAPTAAQVHQGAPGASGPVVITLPTPVVGQTAIGCITDTDADAVNADPGAFYVNVLNAEFPEGAVRGQLGEIGVDFGADLSDVEVVPGPGDGNAFGFVLGFTTTQPGVLCTVVLALSEDPVTGAHLHQGPPDSNGPEVLALDAIDVDDLASEAPDLGIECQRTDLADDVAQNPSAFYVDVHSESFPDGALRGQLDFGGFSSVQRAGDASAGFRTLGAAFTR